LAKKHNLFVVEDAAQGVMSTYKGRALGTIGHIGCFSFHETKNYTAVLTAAPFRGVPQPEAHGRRNLTTSLLRKRNLRRALSCCVPAFNHIRRGGSCCSPTTRNLYNPDTPTTQRVKNAIWNNFINNGN